MPIPHKNLTYEDILHHQAAYDIFSFAIPDEGKIEFDSNSEYFLGTIVTFRNEDKLEVIDGQRRIKL